MWADVDSVRVTCYCGQVFVIPGWRAEGQELVINLMTVGDETHCIGHSLRPSPNGRSEP